MMFTKVAEQKVAEKCRHGQNVNLNNVDGFVGLLFI